MAKAFDKMDWDYIAQILHIYNLPQKFANWVMSCIKSAEFSIILNGRGDGFIKPRSGLRQGCSLSPYVFILGMDFLSRKMQFLVNSGSLRGVKIAPTAPSITNCLYADDLLIFGAAKVEEATLLMETLEEFSSVSGQRVGPSKSSIWFSKITPQ